MFAGGNLAPRGGALKLRSALADVPRVRRIGLKEVVATGACAALVLVPWAADGRPNPYSVGAAGLLAGLLLGIGGVAVVFVLCLLVAAGVYVDVQLHPAQPSPSGEGDGRWLFVFFCLTAFPVVLSCLAAAGAAMRWLVRWSYGAAAPLDSPRVQGSVGWAAAAVIVAAATWSSESFVPLLALPVIAFFVLRRGPDEQASAQ